MKDSFGNVVSVGDYLVFATKTQNLSSLALGRVTKMTDKCISMQAIRTHGQTLEEYFKQRQEAYDRLVAGGHTGAWVEKYAKDNGTYKTRINDATTSYKIPAHTLPPGLIQILQD